MAWSALEATASAGATGAGGPTPRPSLRTILRTLWAKDAIYPSQLTFHKPLSRVLAHPSRSREAKVPSAMVWCPASTIFAGWRQSVLPVHLLGLAPLLGSIDPVAGDVKLQDDGVVHDPVNRRGGGHGVGEDALPLREDQV